MATKAQVEALRWLIAKDITTRIPSSALAGLYEERYRSNPATPRHGGKVYLGQGRQSAWRRTSGTVLSRMRDEGLVEWDGWATYNPYYRITDKGREAAGKET